MPTARHLLSDIGGVVLQLDWVGPATQMARRCSPPPAQPEDIATTFLRDPMVHEYECGRVDRRTFIAHVRQQFGFLGTDEEFVAIWRQMFRHEPAMIAAWRSLVGAVSIWYLSNTSDLHVPWIFEAFPEMAVHSGHALSFELGVRKPDPEFFLRALARLGLAPHECLFVDDDLANCAAAESCGIPSVHHVAPSTTLARVRSWLMTEGWTPG